ncbi:heme exporter protein CcmD [Dyella sp.]|jgi:heme exporter protein D|uniref:heme exporter protein CcmD n=1 Tax=Dyella sp. TaxID=1869338 RepID=UPI002D79E983|nr:heme exporter protein CcmD [Dyella sp.]HET6432432.1 heme exporter protein CcmD [Dyella sp.]
MSDFFAMGGYAAYVWPSYAVFLLVLLADAIAPTMRRRRLLRELRARIARQAARHNRDGASPTAPERP